MRSQTRFVSTANGLGYREVSWVGVLLAMLGSAAVGLLLLASPASAAAPEPVEIACNEGTETCFEGGETEGAKEIYPSRLAVDESSGDVYVIDYQQNVVDRFSHSGKYLSQLKGAETPTGTFSFNGSDDSIAVDNSGGPSQGNVYVLGANAPGRLTAYNAAGEFLWQADNPVSFPKEMCGVAVDPGGSVWVGDYFQGVSKLSITNGEVAVAANYSGSTCHIAIDNGAFYRTSWSGPVTKHSGSITGTETTLDGGSNMDVTTESMTEDVYAVHGGGASGSAVLGYDSEGHAATNTFGSGTLRGVAADGSHGRVYVSHTPSTGEASAVTVFNNPLNPRAATPSPYVRTEGVTSAGAGEVELAGRVDPAGAETTCRFEVQNSVEFKAVGGFYGSRYVPCASNPGSGEGEVPVSSEMIAGLNTAATYHYRIVASNSGGMTNGSSGTFHLVKLGVAAAGKGSVSASSGGISNCEEAGGVCTGIYASGNKVVLTATAQLGSSFAGWLGCEHSSSATCEVTAGAGGTVTAVFVESAAQGPKGEKGDTGAQGSPGAQGSSGITGPQGKEGPQGPAGPAGKVTCKVKGSKKVKVTCSVKQGASSSALRWRLMRSGHAVSHGTSTGALHLDLGHLRPGRYLLHVQGQREATVIDVG